MTSRAVVWCGFAVAWVSAVALAGYLFVVGLDKAAMAATVLGAFLAMLALIVAVTGLLVAVRKRRDPGSGARQLADRADVDGPLKQSVGGGKSGVEQSANRANAGSLDQHV
ncbi:hypothetical protein [Nocardia salmonicida]|uniref:hypothetical protein n=1 Tax=Nocardia salmonicida TaxID=53431 RepID=UPI003630843C